MARHRRSRVPVALVVLAVAVFVGGYVILAPHPHPPAGVTMTNLASVSQLQTRFNRDRGEPRLILIFSPT